MRWNLILLVEQARVESKEYCFVGINGFFLISL